MGRTEKHTYHCNCINKDIEINVIHIEEKGIEIMSATTCNTINPKEPMHIVNLKIVMNVY